MWKPPKDLDTECVALCVAMNSLPGIVTESSCSGHGKQPYRIWFRVTDFDKRGFITLARCTCPRYYPFPFVIKVDHGDVHPIGFLLEGPRACFKKADLLANEITKHVLDRTPGYNILSDRMPKPMRKLHGHAVPAFWAEPKAASGWLKAAGWSLARGRARKGRANIPAPQPDQLYDLHDVATVADLAASDVVRQIVAWAKKSDAAGSSRMMDVQLRGLS